MNRIAGISTTVRLSNAQENNGPSFLHPTLTVLVVRSRVSRKMIIAVTAICKKAGTAANYVMCRRASLLRGRKLQYLANISVTRTFWIANKYLKNSPTERASNDQKTREND